jgi:UDP-N-acetylglucosamine 2-epimerase (non-hydrolysing)
LKKIAICVGTRPNFIKITQFERHFSNRENVMVELVHTGQHFDENMSTIFFQELKLKRPDIYLNAKGNSQIELIADIMVKFQAYVDSNKPDIILVPGDVNSSLACAIVANRNNIPIGHIESGLRSFDRSMPEEINRILIDDLSDLYFVTEKSGIDNLVNEGKDKKQIHFVGNTMIDTLIAFESEIDQRNILNELDLHESYGLLTFHRPSNVDDKNQLTTLVYTLLEIAKKTKLVFTVHPRTLNNLKKFELFDLLETNESILIVGALGYLDFMKLVKNATFILTDSGGIQEESSFLNVPCLTVRENTERPITITEGSNELINLNKEKIIEKIERILKFETRLNKNNAITLWDGKSSERIVDTVCNYLM